MSNNLPRLLSLLHREIINARVWSALLAVIAAWPMGAQTDSIQQLRDTERRESIAQHQTRLRPANISDTTIESWKVTFDLDDTQQEFLDALHDEYKRRCERLDTLYRVPIVERWYASFRYDRDLRAVVPVPNPQLIELYEKHVGLIQELFSADQHLFESFASQLLTPAQSLLSREHASRLLSFVEIPAEQPTARLDVLRLIDRIEFDEFEQLLIDPLLREHYTTIVDTLQDAIPQIRHTSASERYRLLVDLGPEWSAVANEKERRKFERTLQTLAGATASIPLWLADQNRRTIRLLEDHLEYSKSAVLFDLYSRAIDPDLFEEVDDLREFVRVWKAKLPEDEERDAAMDDSHQRIERRIRMRTDKFFKTREERAAQQSAVVPISSGEKTDAAIHRIQAEIDELAFRIKRRELLMQMASSVISIVQSSLPEESQDVRSFHDMQDARQDADRWREDRLQERLEELLVIESERNRDN